MRHDIRVNAYHSKPGEFGDAAFPKKRRAGMRRILAVTESGRRLINQAGSAYECRTVELLESLPDEDITDLHSTLLHPQELLNKSDDETARVPGG